MSVDSIVTLKNIGKIYDTGVEALKGVNFEFPVGKLSTLLGPSGCGKTTLLKLLGGALALRAAEAPKAGGAGISRRWGPLWMRPGKTATSWGPSG